jgi:hypothetical protein
MLAVLHLYRMQWNDDCKEPAGGEAGLANKEV